MYLEYDFKYHFVVFHTIISCIIHVINMADFRGSVLAYKVCQVILINKYCLFYFGGRGRGVIPEAVGLWKYFILQEK